MGSSGSLNHIFRTVWNQALGVMVAVAEISTGRGKSATVPGHSKVDACVGWPAHRLQNALLSLAVAFAWGAIPTLTFANPSGGVAIQGQATFTTNGSNLLVTTQNGAGLNHSAINWQNFSIPTGSTTYFQQPNASSTSINRVVTNTPSLIFGTLGSNGNLVLVNQSGITVGAGAVVDTAGFTASVLRMSDADALSGRMRFGDASSTAGAVSVMGSVLARSGDVVLMGSSVDTGSNALVQAPNGNTVLAAGQQIEITGRGLEGIVMQVQAPSDSAVNLGTLKGDAVGIFAGTLKHSGLIQATTATLEGGKVVLKAARGADIAGKVSANGLTGGTVDIVVAHSIDAGNPGSLVQTSAIEAYGSDGMGGAVHITADNILSAGAISVDGATSGGQLRVLAAGDMVSTAAAVYSADGASASGGDIAVATGGGNFSSASYSALGNMGGKISITGRNVTLIAASMDASGDSGGGVVHVGGKRHGLGGFSAQGYSLSNATELTLSGATIISANAINAGSGGEIVLWSDGTNRSAASISARGGALGGDGGFVEVSGKGGLGYAGALDLRAANGKAGTLLLDPKDIVIDGNAAVGGLSVGSIGATLADPHPVAGNYFGGDTTVLSNGNIVVAVPLDSLVANSAGAVYLFSGSNGALISTLSGSNVADRVGAGGVTALVANGNFVVNSYLWGNITGAVTWGSGITGVNGTVSALNSLVGSSPSSSVGTVGNISGWDARNNGSVSNLGKSTGVVALTNGNYVVVSPYWGGSNQGAATWGNGMSGVRGTVSPINSLTGSGLNDFVGFSVIALKNGNYVVGSPDWGGGGLYRGAATWGNGSSGTVGVVDATNSLVGSVNYETVGASITALNSSGGDYNYVVNSYGWGSNGGAVSWGNGAGGSVGVVSSANSLVGATNQNIGWGNSRNATDAVLALTNGNYVVNSSFGSGLATWGDGSTTGTRLQGNATIANSLQGSLGSWTITALANGNYVVVNPIWNPGAVPGAGAVTWGSGTDGVKGVVSTSNSLYGGNANDNVGWGGITALTNGNYVVSSPHWANGGIGGAGAVTWGNGATGTTGQVTVANSLVGSLAGDQVGWNGATSMVVALSNGNYVVGSRYWDTVNTTLIADVGAVTWGDGSTGGNRLVGPISSSNSLVGSTFGDQVGAVVMPLQGNGNYVVSSFKWTNSNATATNAGAVTWGNGLGGTIGSVSSTNSVIGSLAGDFVGSGGILALSNGNYLAASPNWGGGRGAVTWASGVGSTTGTIAAFGTAGIVASLVGGAANDGIGSWKTTLLSNGDYVVNDPSWQRNTGYVGLGRGTTGLSGVASSANGLVGTASGDQLGYFYNPIAGVGGEGVKALSNGGYIVSSSSYSSYVGSVSVQGIPSTGLQFAFSPSSTLSINPLDINAQLDAGTTITLQASNDITQYSAANIVSIGSGNLTLQAGRSVLLQGNITMAGEFSVTANDQGAIAANRSLGNPILDASTATITAKTIQMMNGGANGGDVLAGSMNVNGIGNGAAGGSITIEAGGANPTISFAANSIVNANGSDGTAGLTGFVGEVSNGATGGNGISGGAGGTIILRSAGSLNVNGTSLAIHADGGSGGNGGAGGSGSGSFSPGTPGFAGGDGGGGGNGGNGGTFSIQSPSSITVTGPLIVTANGGLAGNGGKGGVGGSGFNETQQGQGSSGGQGGDGGAGGTFGGGGAISIAGTNPGADISLSSFVNLYVNGGSGQNNALGYGGSGGSGGVGGSSLLGPGGTGGAGGLGGISGTGGSGGSVTLRTVDGSINARTTWIEVSGGLAGWQSGDSTIGGAGGVGSVTGVGGQWASFGSIGGNGGAGGTVTAEVTAPTLSRAISVDYGVDALGGGYGNGGGGALGYAGRGNDGNGGTILFRHGGTVGGSVTLISADARAGNYSAFGSVTMLADGGDLTVNEVNAYQDSLNLQAPQGRVFAGTSTGFGQENATANSIRVTSKSGIGSSVAPLKVYESYVNRSSLHFVNTTSGDVNITSDFILHVDDGINAGGSIFLTSTGTSWNCYCENMGSAIQFDGNLMNSTQTASVTASGNITYTANAMDVTTLPGLFGTTVTTGANSFVQWRPATTGTAMAVSSANTPWLAKVKTANLIVGDLFNTGGIDIGTTTLSSSDIAKLTLQTASALAVSGAVQVSSIYASANGIALSLTGSLTGTGTGDAIVLNTAGSFVNNAGIGGLVTPGGGRWLVYASSPVNVTKGGLVPTMYQYGTVFGNAIDLAGSGFVYASGLSVNANFSGQLASTYGTSPTATLGYSLSGLDVSDTSYTLSKVGGTPIFSYWPIDATTSVGTYALQYASGLSIPGGSTLAVGTAQSYQVKPMQLTVTASLVDSTRKVYDGTTAALLTPFNFSLIGFVNGDQAGITKTSGDYASKNAGSGLLVSTTLAPGDFAPQGNTQLSNYILPTTASGNIGSITALAINLNTPVVTKIYDGTTAYTTTVSDLVSLSSALVGGDTVSAATIKYSDKNAGLGNKTAAIAGWTINDGNGGNNYTVTIAGNTTSTINLADLWVSTSNVTKTYDATIGMVGATGQGAVVVGGTLFAGDSLSGGTFAYIDPNAGQGNKVVTVSGVTAGGGTNFGNYNVIFQNNTTSTINPLTVTWTGNAGTSWSAAGNWSSPFVPDGVNVITPQTLSVTTAIYDLTAPSSVQSINASGSFTLQSGSLTINGDLITPDYSQSGGALSVSGALTVQGKFLQSAGIIDKTGVVSITQDSGDLTFGKITGSTISLQASKGAINQRTSTGPTDPTGLTGLVTLRTTGGASLMNTANRISGFAVADVVSGGVSTRSSGNIALTNGAAMDLSGISLANGNLSIDNTGGISNSVAIKVDGGTVDIKSHSPITVSSAVTASGNITLAALTPDGTSNITLNGAMTSTAGGISIQAYNNFIQNSNLSAALAIDVSTIAGSLTFGPGAYSIGNPVTYTVNGAPYMPPWIASTLSGGATDFVVAFLDQFQAVLDAQQAAPIDDPLGLMQSSQEGIVVEGEICKP